MKYFGPIPGIQTYKSRLVANQKMSEGSHLPSEKLEHGKGLLFSFLIEQEFINSKRKSEALCKPSDIKVTSAGSVQGIRAKKHHNVVIDMSVSELLVEKVQRTWISHACKYKLNRKKNVIKLSPRKKR